MDNNTNTTRTDEIAANRAADEQIAAAWATYYTEADKIKSLAKAIKDNEYMIGFYAKNANQLARVTERATELAAKLEATESAAAELRKAAIDLDKALYTGWTRFFLVKHIHSSQHCSSFRYNTRIGWLPAVSGLTEAEAVAEYSATLCTICFPSAPVELTTKPVDDSACTGKLDNTKPYNLQRVSKWATCTDCGQVVSATSLGNLRKHKKA